MGQLGHLILVARNSLQKSLVGTEIHPGRWVRPVGHVCGRVPWGNSPIFYPQYLSSGNLNTGMLDN